LLGYTKISWRGAFQRATRRHRTAAGRLLFAFADVVEVTVVHYLYCKMAIFHHVKHRMAFFGSRVACGLQVCIHDFVNRIKDESQIYLCKCLLCCQKFTDRASILCIQVIQHLVDINSPCEPVVDIQWRRKPRMQNC
jgi:hypothetical protein